MLSHLGRNFHIWESSGQCRPSPCSSRFSKQGKLFCGGRQSAIFLFCILKPYFPRFAKATLGSNLAPAAKASHVRLLPRAASDSYQAPPTIGGTCSRIALGSNFAWLKLVIGHSWIGHCCPALHGGILRSCKIAGLWDSSVYQRLQAQLLMLWSHMTLQT